MAVCTSRAAHMFRNVRIFKIRLPTLMHQKKFRGMITTLKILKLINWIFIITFGFKHKKKMYNYQVILKHIHKFGIKVYFLLQFNTFDNRLLNK